MSRRSPAGLPPVEGTRAAPPDAPPITDRTTFDAALAEQVEREKDLTRCGDRVSAARRRLPMVAVDDYASAGPDGPVGLVDLFMRHQLLMVQHVMFDPAWREGCPSCTWAVDTLPASMSRLSDEGIAFAMVSQAPIEMLEAWRARRGWGHLWVSSGATSHHDEWGWTLTDEHGRRGPVPGCSSYLLRDGVPYLTWSTRARGTEAVQAVPHFMDRTCYGRQQDWEDILPGWRQHPTYA